MQNASKDTQKDEQCNRVVYILSQELAKVNRSSDYRRSNSRLDILTSTIQQESIADSAFINLRLGTHEPHLFCFPAPASRHPTSGEL